jgi:hypothetical protein
MLYLEELTFNLIRNHMKWYSTRLIFQICIDQDLRALQFDESIRLFQAASEDHALDVARKAGMADETSFVNIRGERIFWKFIDVNMVHCIGEIAQGQEVFSDTRIEEKSAPYIRSVRQYAQHIQSNSKRTIKIE